MSSDRKLDLKAEIGHVLFLDIVGYSKLLINQQSDRLQTLKQIVRDTAQVRTAKDEGSLIRLPTGDGMALVFRSNVEQPLECALEIGAALQRHPELPLRMGIHSGPINPVLDVNERANAAGAGIDGAQRVMDCGDAGHILLSKRAADDLAPYPRWNPHLHDLGECEVKHGLRVHLLNFCDGALGNPALPSKLATKIDRPVAAPPARSRWPPLVFVCAAFAVVRRSCLVDCDPGDQTRAGAQANRPGHSGKEHRRVALREPERGESERLFCRWRAGRNPDQPGEDR